jgi:hypothetical protein
MTEPKSESIKEIADYLDGKIQNDFGKTQEKKEMMNGIRKILQLHHPL